MSHILSQNALKHFDWEVYLMNYPELTDLKTQQDARFHYAHVGHLENRTDQIPSLFDWERYADTYRHLSLTHPRDAYIHFMRLGRKYKQGQEVVQPLQRLLLLQYDTIIEHIHQSLRHDPDVPVKPFTLPPRPKNQTSVAEYRQPHAPNVLNPPKQPLKKSRPDNTPALIENRIQPKVLSATPPMQQQIKTTASSIMHPPPVQKPAVPQKRLPLYLWPPRHVEERRPSEAPSIFRPLKQPSRSGIIRTSVSHTATPAPSQQPVVPPPLESTTQKRSSDAPSVFQPLKKPSRSAIIHTHTHTTTTNETTPTMSFLPPLDKEQLPSLPSRASVAPSPYQPLQQPSRSGIIHTNSKENTLLSKTAQWPPFLPTTKPSHKKRSSEPPIQFQPLQQPSRAGIIKTKTAEETMVHTRRPKPASMRPLPDNPVTRQPYKHPSRSATPPSKDLLSLTMYPPTKPRLAVKSVVATRVLQKKQEQRHITPFRYSPHSHTRKPKEGELVLQEPPSKYFSRIGVVMGPPRCLNPQEE